MRNRRKDENFEERKRRRAENSEILRQIAEKFETREDSASVNKINNDVNISNIAKDQEQNKIENGFDIIAKMMENRMNEKNNVDIVKDNNNEEKVSNNNSIYGRKFEVSDEQKKALEDFFSFNSKKVEYGEDTNISKKDRNRFRKSRPSKRI